MKMKQLADTALVAAMLLAYVPGLAGEMTDAAPGAVVAMMPSVPSQEIALPCVPYDDPAPSGP